MSTSKKRSLIDSLPKKKDKRICEFDLLLSRYVTKYKHNSVLFSGSRRTESFFTQDSKLYYTPEEYRRLKRGERIARIVGRLDSLNSKVFEKTRRYPMGVPENFITVQLHKAYVRFRDSALELAENSTRKISVAKMWNLTIVGAVIFGMFTMTMIYRYLGQGVSAAIKENTAQQTQAIQAADKVEQTAKIDAVQEINNNIDMDSITSLLSEESSKKDLEKEIMDMVKGTPIEKMVPLIVKKDRTVAAFMIGIAKQESGWGIHVPVYQGNDCYNYWGYRGKNPVGTGGHTCFDSPEDAVNTVAKRIQFLVSSKKLDTPEKMIIWKCGDCSWDNKKNMQNWISAVSIYFGKLDK